MLLTALIRTCHANWDRPFHPNFSFSGDRAVRDRLRQAKAGLRQTIVVGNRILANCGVGRDNGEASSVAVTSTVAVPPAEETGAASVSLTESGSAIAIPTARPTASADLTSIAAPVASAAPEAAQPSVAPPQVVVPPVLAPGNEACPPAAIVTVVSTFLLL